MLQRYFVHSVGLYEGGCDCRSTEQDGRVIHFFSSQGRRLQLGAQLFFGRKGGKEEIRVNFKNGSFGAWSGVDKDTYESYIRTKEALSGT